MQMARWPDCCLDTHPNIKELILKVPWLVLVHWSNPRGKSSLGAYKLIITVEENSIFQNSPATQNSKRNLAVTERCY